MNKSGVPVRPSGVVRRDFLKMGVAAAAAMAIMNADMTWAQGKPWWDARPAKPGPPDAIDIHAHWAPEAYFKAVAELGHPIKNIDPLNFDLDMRRKWMDERGVKMHVLTLNGGMLWQALTPEQGLRLAQMFNDAGPQAHAAFPDRFVASIELPIKDADMSLKELNRVAGRPGLRAVHMPDSMERHGYLFDPAFAPLLARIEELGLPIIFHQMNGEDNVFTGAVAPGLEATYEHAELASGFITTGTLDKYPKLEIVLPHAGGAFPYQAARIEHFLYHMRGTQINLQHPFREYLRRFHYDYLTYYPEGLRFLISLVGSDRIVIGTDSPDAKDIMYPSAVVDEMHLPAIDRDRIVKGNAMRLFHI